MKKKRFIGLMATLATLLIGANGIAAPEHAEISGPFATPMEVTKKCLECHEQSAHQVMETSHWTWNLEQTIPGEGKVLRGKKNVINNFCISINGNWSRCTSCHVGYGWKDASFDFSDTSRVDCLVCHDTTDTYKKYPSGAGMPYGFTKKETKKSVDLALVAQNVGIPDRDNCIACHGFGGGGNNVKHGDIDSSMKNPLATYDVHMGSDGKDMVCQDCHTTNDHKIKGNAMVVSPAGSSHISCTNCHDEKPHDESLLNNHMAKVACQTCHIPTFAKDIPTKLSWDWSTAGQEKETPTDEYGKGTYHKKKGNFTWGKNVQPTYAWYNGSAGFYKLGDKIDPSMTTKLSWPNGDINDEGAKIYPFKVHSGKQIYDSKFQYLITPKLFGPKNDPAAYWAQYDWKKAAQAGMEISGLEFSGEYDFAPTAMYWRINHMVVPATEALKCLDCHGDEGRLDWQKLGYQGDPMRENTAQANKKIQTSSSF